jgi:uncharacterized membrane protein
MRLNYRKKVYMEKVSHISKICICKSICEFFINFGRCGHTVKNIATAKIKKHGEISEIICCQILSSYRSVHFLAITLGYNNQKPIHRLIVVQIWSTPNSPEIYFDSQIFYQI